MADRRAQTFVLHYLFWINSAHLPFFSIEALSAFIEAQRALLSRTVLDIERLKVLRIEADEDPISLVETLSDHVFMLFLFHENRKS